MVETHFTVVPTIDHTAFPKHPLCLHFSFRGPPLTPRKIMSASSFPNTGLQKQWRSYRGKGAIAPDAEKFGKFGNFVLRASPFL